MGLADYLASLLSSLGLKGIFAEWFGCIMAWICYHIYCYINWMVNRADDETHYFTKARSMYYEVDNSEDPEGKKEDEEKDHAMYSRARGKSLRIPNPALKKEAQKYKFSSLKTFGMFTRAFFQLAI